MEEIVMAFASPFLDVDIPDASVFDLLFADIEPSDMDRVAIVDVLSAATTTYRQMVEQVNATAGALAARGICVGDVVGLLAQNSSLFAIAFHGILRGGHGDHTQRAVHRQRHRQTAI